MQSVAFFFIWHLIYKFIFVFHPLKFFLFGSVVYKSQVNPYIFSVLLGKEMKGMKTTIFFLLKQTYKFETEYVSTCMRTYVHTCRNIYAFSIKFKLLKFCAQVIWPNASLLQSFYFQRV